MTDAVDRKVQRLLREGSAKPRDPSRYHPALWCRCLHHSDEHHGTVGAGACSMCDCAGFEPADVECPDCLTQFSSTLPVCPRCGLILVELAQRVADDDAPR